jgi:23S rRNA (adenine2503-C2)-methyltransferase
MVAELLEKINLLGLSKSKMEAFFHQAGEKSFRATQVLKWIHQNNVNDFEQMTNLSKALREKLSAIAEVRPPKVISENISQDGTRKWIIEVGSGSRVETVFIPDGKRGTLCISSQAGCILDCSFCSTGKQGFNSNLTSSEIIGQLWIANRSLGAHQLPNERQITNVVMMGMGEPLLNFDNVVESLDLMMDDIAYGLSKRRVTVSTAGVVPAIDELGKHTDVSLAVSLHAPTNALRDQLVPLNKKYPIEALLAACQRYLDKLSDRRHITIEYTLLAGVNDRIEHAKQLAALLSKLSCKINLIPFNPFPHSGYEKPSTNAIRRFQDVLIQAGYTATVRTTRGDDIDAACGQLVGNIQDKTKRNERYIARWDASQNPINLNSAG